MSYNVVGSGGHVVECRLDNKISEIYDLIYLETETIKEKYKGIVKGIIVDKKRYDHILQSLASAFKCNSSDELIALLNSLNSSLSASEHIKFFFERFELSSYLYYSVEKMLKSLNPPADSKNLYDDLYSILYSIKNTNPSVAAELEIQLDSFLKKAYESGFESNCLSSLKKKYDKPYIIEGSSLKGIKELNSIVLSIDRLHEIHICLYCEISEMYTTMMKITNIISSLH